MYYTLGMEITDIAQIVTGIATLVVALILVSQLYQQHKDTEIQLTMDSWQLNQSLILAEIRYVDLSKILSKSGFSPDISRSSQTKLHSSTLELF